MELQGTLSSSVESLKKNKAGVLTFLDFRIFQKATMIKTVWYLHMDRSIYQRNIIERL